MNNQDKNKSISKFEFVNKAGDASTCKLGVICAKPDGTTILGAIGKDRGTLRRKLLFAVVNAEEEISELIEVSPSRYKKDLDCLRDFEGIDNSEDVEAIWKCFQVHRQEGTLKTISMGEEKANIKEAYNALCGYVEKYREPERVFIQNGYANIESTYFQAVLKKLGLGYTRLALLKGFKAWGMLRTNSVGAAHEYTYKIGRKWYISIPLPTSEGGERV